MHAAANDVIERLKSLHTVSALSAYFTIIIAKAISTLTADSAKTITVRLNPTLVRQIRVFTVESLRHLRYGVTASGGLCYIGVS